MSQLSIDLQLIADIITDDLANLQLRMNSTIRSLVKQIQPDEEVKLGHFVLDFDEKIYWNPSNTDVDTTYLTAIHVLFQWDPAQPSGEMGLEFAFYNDEEFRVTLDDLFIETKRDLISALLNRLHVQRTEKDDE